MKLELNTNLIPIFSGTYGTIWDVNDYLEREVELSDGEYDFDSIDIDFAKYMESILECYKNNDDWILGELGIDWIKSIKFTGHYSPREYNFSNDQLDLTLDIHYPKLMKWLLSLNKSDMDSLDVWLHENYTSYDGFWSHTPNNFGSLLQEIRDKGDHFDQAISALITYHIEADAIEEYVYDDFMSNGYGSDSLIINQ